MPESIAPLFPYFGGKRRIAEKAWNALGDPGHYIEPFAGSAAVLLARRPFPGARVETVNDIDGLLVNTLRSIQHYPDDVAEAAYGPMTEIDYHARLAWLHKLRTPSMVPWLEGDPRNCDPEAAGWWLYTMACAIGNTVSKTGPWKIIDSHLRDTRTVQTAEGNTADAGIVRGSLHLGHGRGVKRPGLKELADLKAYMEVVSRRLQNVRITCRDWKKVIGSVSLGNCRRGDGSVGIFFDPPYENYGDRLYGGG